MKKIISIVLIGLLLSGCQVISPHKVDIEQGNIISEANASRLRLGMNEGEVRSILGNPLFVNIFSSNRTVYIYTFQSGSGTRIEKRLICVFQNGRLHAIERS